MRIKTQTTLFCNNFQIEGSFRSVDRFNPFSDILRRVFLHGIESHTATHRIPTNPGITNPPRQPKYPDIQTVSGGATTAPMADPPMAIPLASARSFSSNHSYTALAAPGKHPPSPSPSKKRYTTNW